MQNKRFQKEIDDFKYHGEHTPFALGTFAVMFVCLVGLIVATFTSFNLSHFWFAFNDGGVSVVSKNYFYVAQIPSVVFMAAILGLRYSVLTLIIYLLIAIFWMPIFGLGGGIPYIKTYFFGFILGYFPLVCLVSFFLRKFKGYVGILCATFAGVLSAYATGLLYGVVLLIFRQIDFQFLLSTFNLMNLSKILYDLIISLLFILLSYPTKKFLWLAMKSDFISRKKNKKQNEHGEK